VIVTSIAEPAIRTVLLAAGFMTVFDGPGDGSPERDAPLVLPL
jgi:hypothetical protein